MRYLIAMAVACGWLGSMTQAVAADSAPTFPAIIQAGFAEWPRGGVAASLEVWRKGGLIENDHKIPAEVSYFKHLEAALGIYKSFELVQAQGISSTSRLVYLAINFEKAVVYARFFLYRTDQDWVVQNIDFNTKPELIIPWFALPSSTAIE